MVTTMPTNMADVAKRPGAARQAAADRGWSPQCSCASGAGRRAATGSCSGRGCVRAGSRSV